MRAREIINEDDYWGDRPDPAGDARRDEEDKEGEHPRRCRDRRGERSGEDQE